MLRQFLAPNRYPFPDEPPPDPPQEGDAPQVAQEKVVRLARHTRQLQRATHWFAKLAGWHHALLCTATFNLVMVPVATWVKPISGQQYGLLFVLFTFLLAIAAKRFVK